MYTSSTRGKCFIHLLSMTFNQIIDHYIYLIIKSQIPSTSYFDSKENGVSVVVYGWLVLAEFREHPPCQSWQVSLTMDIIQTLCSFHYTKPRQALKLEAQESITWYLHPAQHILERKDWLLKSLLLRFFSCRYLDNDPIAGQCFLFIGNLCWRDIPRHRMIIRWLGTFCSSAYLNKL